MGGPGQTTPDTRQEVHTRCAMSRHEPSWATQRGGVAPLDPPDSPDSLQALATQVAQLHDVLQSRQSQADVLAHMHELQATTDPRTTRRVLCSTVLNTAGDGRSAARVATHLDAVQRSTSTAISHRLSTELTHRVSHDARRLRALETLYKRKAAQLERQRQSQPSPPESPHPPSKALPARPSGVPRA